MFKPGPLYKKRKEIMAELKSMPLKTGDIFYNGSNVSGPLGIPFAKLIQLFTNPPIHQSTNCHGRLNHVCIG